MKSAERERGVRLQRIYEPSADRGSYRVLVDRLWPRGVTKEAAALDEWNRDVAPSAELRRWYGHDPTRFDEFARRYREELSQLPAADAVAHLWSLAQTRHVVLVTATRDIDHSGARVLSDHLTMHEG